MQSDIVNPPIKDKEDDDSGAVGQEDTAPTAARTALSARNDHDLRVPYYCEENVWRIAYRKLHSVDPSGKGLKSSLSSSMSGANYMVVFVSNERKAVPMLHQRASLEPAAKPCVWDYHVILLELNQTENKVLMYDVDTTLIPYPIPLSDYLAATFGQVELFFPEYVPCFRLVPADLYLQYFASDRTQMYNAQKNAWNEPPPHYSCILPADSSTDRGSQWDAAPITSPHCNLQYYLDFSGHAAPPYKDLPADAFGTIWTLQQLRESPFLGS